MDSNRGKTAARFLAAALCAGLTVCAGCGEDGQESNAEGGFAVEKEYTQGTNEVKIKLSAEKVEISDLVILLIEASAEQGWEVDLPSVKDALNAFDVRDWESAPDRLGEGDRIVRTRRYRLEPLITGEASVGELTFGFSKDGDGAEAKGEIVTEAIEIEVTSLLEELGTDLVIEDIEGVVDIEADRRIWWICGAAVWMAVVGVVLWLVLRPRKEAEIARIFRPAHEIAYEILRKLAEDKLVEAGRVKEFYERLSDCLRHYIEHRFALRAPEQTTEEFLAGIRNAQSLAAEYRSDLQGFLEHCDLVKFARYEPSIEQIEQTLAMVEAFVDKTRSEEAKVEVSEQEALAG